MQFRKKVGQKHLLGIITSTFVKNRKKIEECYIHCRKRSALQRKSTKTINYFDVKEKKLSWFTKS